MMTMMIKPFFYFAITLCMCFASVNTANANSYNAIKEQIITASIAAYPGNCPCPYNRDRAGRMCGKRSAYSRPRGYSPKCYSDDITERELQIYIKNQK